MSDRELLVGNAIHTMRDPAFIAGLMNTFDGANASLAFTTDLQKVRYFDEGDKAIFVVVCNKAADLTFTWQASNVSNFPSTDTETITAGNVDGFDVVTIADVPGEGQSTLTIDKINTAYMQKYIHCRITFATPSPNQIKDSVSCQLEINTGGSTESMADKIIPVVVKYNKPAAEAATPVVLPVTPEGEQPT